MKRDSENPPAFTTATPPPFRSMRTRTPRTTEAIELEKIRQNGYTTRVVIRTAGSVLGAGLVKWIFASALQAFHPEQVRPMEQVSQAANYNQRHIASEWSETGLQLDSVGHLAPP